MKTLFKTICIFLLIFAAAPINAEELNKGCIIDDENNTICPEDIPEGCVIDYEANELVCAVGYELGKGDGGGIDN